MSMLENRENFWRKMSTKPEITGWDFALKAEEIADFIAGLESHEYDIYCTESFGSYVEKMARAFSVNRADELLVFRLLTNLDLHYFEAESVDLANFLDYLAERNILYIQLFYGTI